MITKTQLIDVLSTFRKLCLSMFQDDIDVLTEEQRSEQLGDHTPQDSFIPQFKLMLSEGQDPIDNICRLVKTPRLLKIILRHCLNTWELLHGELDFDDLLVANVLRLAAPEAFDFILSNCNELRGLVEDGLFKNREERQKAVEKKWESVCSHVTWDTYAAKQLIQFLFYGWKDPDHMSRKNIAPQGFQLSTPTDYWDRFIRGELRTEDRRDQEVLRSIRLWDSTPDGVHYRDKPLSVSLYEDKTFAALFEYFIRSIPDGHDYRGLFTQLFEYALNKYGAESEIDRIPCFMALLDNMRLCDTRTQYLSDPQEHLRWVEDEITKSIPVSLQLANDIFMWFGVGYRGEYERAMKKSDSRLRTHVVSFAKNLFSNNPRKLLKTLSVRHANSCFVFLKHFHEREEVAGFKASEWKWFAELMLDAAEIDPVIITPQLAHLIVTDVQPSGVVGQTINDRIVNDLFGSSQEKLMSILAKDISVAELDPNPKRRVEFAKKHATEWLAQHAEGLGS